MNKILKRTILLLTGIAVCAGCAAKTDGGDSDGGTTTPASTTTTATTDPNGAETTTTTAAPVTDDYTGEPNTPNPNALGNTGEVKLEAGDTYAVISVRDFGDITVKLFPEVAPVAVENFKKLANDGYYTDKIFHRIIANFMVQGGSFDGSGQSAPGEESFDIETSYNARHFYGALSMANSMGKNGTQFFIVNNKETGAFADLESTLPQSEAYTNSFLQELTAAKPTLDDFSYNYYYSQYKTSVANNVFVANATQEVKDKYAEIGGTPHLDGGYTVFGHMIEGFDVLDAISAVEVTADASGALSSPVTPVVIEKVEIKTFE
jgi:cyclophilin family peptidyl-prolyl cis-trans isomerase